MRTNVLDGIEAPRLVSPDIFRHVFHLRAGGPRAFALLRCVAYNDFV